MVCNYRTTVNSAAHTLKHTHSPRWPAVSRFRAVADSGLVPCECVCAIVYVFRCSQLFVLSCQGFNEARRLTHWSQVCVFVRFEGPQWVNYLPSDLRDFLPVFSSSSSSSVFFLRPSGELGTHFDCQNVRNILGQSQKCGWSIQNVKNQNSVLAPCQGVRWFSEGRKLIFYQNQVKQVFSPDDSVGQTNLIQTFQLLPVRLLRCWFPDPTGTVRGLYSKSVVHVSVSWSGSGTIVVCWTKIWPE